ncbi:GntR family transcriptional regulator [Rhodococcoides kyotonense]|uniref:GntR family transcriptional regulator n=1 Tax=Rhodococcoides kyotonense TaxID=398843 RepID=A0A239E159_9NOCA|nr:GntR family transcriptional regulator [Rhodococcus kyotonensis]SNS38008.1 GntR family transcriptional regulator [Rhodococcus kyotonensis]
MTKNAFDREAAALLRKRQDAERAKYMSAQRRTAPGLHNSPHRAYEQLRSAIRTRSGMPDGPLVETALIKSYSVNRNTLRTALQMLASDGLLRRERRTGTVVARHVQEFTDIEIVGRRGTSESDDGTVVMQDLHRSIDELPPFARTRFDTDAELLFTYEQLASVDGEPLFTHSGFIPLGRDHDEFFDRVRLLGNTPRPLGNAFARLFGRPLAETEIDIEATPADADTAALLRIDVGAPLLLREMTQRDVDGVVRQVTFTQFRGDRVALTSEVP